jgi:hypothetical protein
MKCEIIDDELIIENGTATETWAVNQWLRSNAYQPTNYKVKLKSSLAKTDTPTQLADDDRELDDVFGPLTIPSPT